MIRFVQIALLLAVMIPFGWAVRYGDAQLPQRLQDVLSGVPIGFVLCYALWRWDIRTKKG